MLAHKGRDAVAQALGPDELDAVEDSAANMKSPGAAGLDLQPGWWLKRSHGLAARHGSQVKVNG